MRRSSCCWKTIQIQSTTSTQCNYKVSCRSSQSCHGHDQPPMGERLRCREATCFRSSMKKSLPFAIMFAERKRLLITEQQSSCKLGREVEKRTLRAPGATRSLVARVFSGRFVEGCFWFCRFVRVGSLGQAGGDIPLGPMTATKEACQ